MTSTKGDRELLELAAKAAGIHVVSWDNVGSCWIPTGCHNELKPWNPLVSDGDALRLAVKLGIDVYLSGSIDGAVNAFFSDTQVKEPVAGDSFAATRRAIVRAAASLAEGNKETTR